MSSRELVINKEFHLCNCKFSCSVENHQTYECNSCEMCKVTAREIPTEGIA